MEDAIINEIANKCEVDTCEISDQVTNSKEPEGGRVRGWKGEGAKINIMHPKNEEERLCGGGCNLWRRCFSQIPAVVATK